MEIKCKTLLWLFYQQILILNCQIIRPPPILQWFIPILNPTAYQTPTAQTPTQQTPTQQTPTQQTPNSPFNLLNFLQLIRPAPGITGTPTNISPISNGIIPFLLQYHLQNFRPTLLGQQEQENTGNQLQIPQNFNIGNSQSTNLIPLNLGNIDDLTALQLQQLLQGNNLGNNPILLGLQPISPNQLTEIGSTSDTIAPIAGAYGLYPNIPTIAPTNSFPTVKPTEINSVKPVTEFSNDFKTTESPFVSLAPVKPYEPIDPTVISYIPYTTTVKPFITTTTESDDLEDFKPQVFPDPDQLSPFPTRTTLKPSRTTTFVPLFYERAQSSKTQNPSNQKGLTQKIINTLAKNSTEPSILSSIKDVTSEMPPSSTAVVEKGTTSAGTVLTLKENVTKIDLEKVAFLNLAPTNETQINLNGQPLDNKIELLNGIKIMEQSKDNNISDSPPKMNEEIELLQDSDAIMNEKSQPESETKPSELLIQNEPIERQPTINLIPIQSDEIPTSFIQGDELPNEKITLSNQHEQNDALNIQTILFNPPNQILFGSNPDIHQPIHQISNPNPIIIIDRVPYQGNSYPNIPHFAYLRPYSNWLHPVTQARNWPPMYFNNFQETFNLPR